MGARGLNGSNEVLADPVNKFIAEFEQWEAAVKEELSIPKTSYEAQIDYFNEFLVSTADPDAHTTTRPEVESMPQSDSNTTFAELRAELAEARSNGKLAEAIGRSDARHAEVVGRVDTGFAEIRGQILAVSTRLEGIERTTGGIKATVIVTGLATGLAIAALTVAILTYGQAWFGIGISTRDVVKAAVAEMQQQSKLPATQQQPNLPAQSPP